MILIALGMKDFLNTDKYMTWSVLWRLCPGESSR